MHAIQSIQAREILDSRGFPTVEVALTLQEGACGIASVPSGASTGSAEALELRDADAKRYMGKGVLKAVQHVSQVIAPALVGQHYETFASVDQCMLALDGTPNKAQLGANAILAVSLACAKAMAQAERMPFYQYLAHHVGEVQPNLPAPLMNILNGGAHADNPLDFQEFMIVPAGFDHFADALRAGVEIFHALKSILKQAGLSVAIGDEGGFAPDVRDHDEAAAWVLKAIETAGYRPGKDVYLALDVASTEFYQDDHYHLHCEGKIYTSAQMVERLQAMVRQYPIVSIEDGIAENDWAGWQLLTQTLGDQVQLVGDDLFVTNTDFLKRGIDDQAGNAILIKPNQIGSLSETLAAMAMAKAAHFNSIVSHRSGETEDTTIADIAVGVGAGQIKTGSLCRSERVAKYNRLLAIADDLGVDAVYAGRSIYNRWIGS